MRDLRDDLVRRGDVMDELVKEYNRRWQEGGLKLAWIEKAVDSVRPVADVRENVHGKWVTKEETWRDGIRRRIIRCDQCGRAKPLLIFDQEGECRFCPWCGAEMEKDDGEI